MSVTGGLNRITTVSLPTLVAAGAAGIVCGVLVLGIGGRAAMRVVAVLGDLEPAFTVGGTVFILMIGGFLGTLLGLLYGAIRGILPFGGLGSGLIFGLGAALLLVVLPLSLNEPSGELALATPRMVMALFGGLLTAFGAATGTATELIARRQQVVADRRISILWPAALFIGTIFLFAQASSLAGEFQPIPHFFSSRLRDAGVGFVEMREMHGGSVLLFTFGYWALAMGVLLAGKGERAGRWGALGLLMIGGLLFHSAQTPGLAIFGMAPHAIAPWTAGVPRLLQGLGFGAVVGLLYVTPDGRFRSRGWRWAWLAWTAWFIVWLIPLFPGTALDAMEWPAWLRALPVLLAVGSGLAAIGLRYREAAADRRGPLGLALAGYGLAFAALGLIWLAIPTVNGWLAGRAIGVSYFFSFGPYLWPWLLLPGVTMVVLQRASR